MTDVIRFWLDGQWETVGDIDPTMTLLTWLRTTKGRVGSKEGCAEGDCGACTVLVGALEQDTVVWRALNACILFLPMLDGRALMTVESLSADGDLHPVQEAMVRLHGAQCGFCTPGIVMSLYGRAIAAQGTRAVPATDVLAGNLCRCTGYGPILAAAQAVPVVPRDDRALADTLRAAQRAEPLRLLYRDPVTGTRRRWFAPRSADQLAALRLKFPKARLVAGATDVGLWVTKQQRVIADIIALGDVADLAFMHEDETGLSIGATLRYTEAQAALARLHPDLGELVRRIGAVQVRNAGTIGGNIANGSPIGDMAPALIALDAVLTLRRGDQRRRLPLERFFIAYGRQDLRPGEFVESLYVPKPPIGQMIRIVKLSKRFDSDISSLCGAFALTITAGVVTAARIAFGGMAGTPKRALACERALVGTSWSNATVERAALALRQDYAPLTDVRGSAEYRLTAAGNLLRRLWYESQGHGGTVLSMAAVDA